MNVAGINIPFIIQNHSREMKGHRYEGYFTVVVSVQAIIGYCPADSVWRHLWEWAMHVLNMTNSDVLLAGKDRQGESRLSGTYKACSFDSLYDQMDDESRI